MRSLGEEISASEFWKSIKRGLVAILAPDGACDGCGETFALEELEIDHVDGRDWQPRALSLKQRVRRYARDIIAGVRLRALCRSCNARDGGGRRYDAATRRKRSL